MRVVRYLINLSEHSAVSPDHPRAFLEHPNSPSSEQTQRKLVLSSSPICCPSYSLSLSPSYCRAIQMVNFILNSFPPLPPLVEHLSFTPKYCLDLLSLFPFSTILETLVLAYNVYCYEVAQLFVLFHSPPS